MVQLIDFGEAKDPDPPPLVDIPFDDSKSTSAGSWSTTESERNILNAMKEAEAKRHEEQVKNYDERLRLRDYYRKERDEADRLQAQMKRNDYHGPPYNL